MGPPHAHADDTAHDHEDSVEDHSHMVIGRDALGQAVVSEPRPADDPESQPPNGTGPVWYRA